MSTNPFVAGPAVDPAALVKANPEILSGARWFWWIAGLSLINTVMIHSGSEVSFIIGLGFTLVADSIFREYQLIAFAIDAVALGMFFTFGWFAARGHRWAFITGAAIYTADALIYVFFSDWMPVALHGLALFYIVRGVIKLNDGLKLAREAALTTVTTEPPIVPPPVVGA